MSAPLSSVEQFSNGMTNYVGLVTFGTVIVMVTNGTWRVSLKPATLVRWMAYFDALSFVLLFAANANTDTIPTCPHRKILVGGSDFISSLKDTAKYGYLAYKALAISGHAKKFYYVTYIVMGINAILYWSYLIINYTFTDGCKPRLSYNYPLIIMFFYWNVVEFVSAGLMLHKLYKVKFGLEVVGAALDSELDAIRKKERLRLLLACLGMIPITVIQTACQWIPALRPYNFSRTYFIYCQLWLVVGSQQTTTPAGSERRSEYSHVQSNGTTGTRKESLIGQSQTRSQKDQATSFNGKRFSFN
ncbi:hypothetical protein BDR26DRAFT_853156 [Obelidium mucronatum]|nr:hypothetical protein BDR26DRAFT_853156 [Obelidium mucronatum]